MVFPATDEIHAAMTAHELKCAIEELEDSSVLHIGMNAQETSFMAHYISKAEKNDVALRIFNLIKFQPDKLDAMLECVNEANFRFRYLKFTVDEQNCSVTAAYDFTSSGEEIGECAYELLLRCSNIIDTCYPIFKEILNT